MKIAIMQPYFFPYIGYWQLINAVDKFVIYDNIQYTKKGWFNRNRYLKNGQDAIFTIPLKKDSDFLPVNQRIISQSYDKKHLVSQLQNAYAKAPYKKVHMQVIEKIINFNNDNLFEYIYNSIQEMCHFLNIETPILMASEIAIDHNLKSAEKVMAICKQLNCECYINPEGGKHLYDKEYFKKNGIELKFLNPHIAQYQQFGQAFIERLSIIDVMMFNSKDEINKMLFDFSFE